MKWTFDEVLVVEVLDDEALDDEALDDETLDDETRDAETRDADFFATDVNMFLPLILKTKNFILNT